MTFADTQRRTWRDNLLFSVLVELTYRCNLDCSFCYNDTNLKGVPLSREQYFGFFEELRDLGTLNLSLSGGEPFAHPDFFVLGKRARDLGFVVRVKSNGHALRGALAQRLKQEIDPFIVEVSLHGACAQTHDRQTRVPGSFVRLMDNLREAQALGLRIKLNSALTAWNEHEIDAMLALADDLQVRIQFDTDITRRDDGDATPLSMAPTRAGLARLVQAQERRAAGSEPAPGSGDDDATNDVAAASAAITAEKHCGAGSSSITVDPYGNVYPCVQWRRRVGNLHQDSVRALWQDSPELHAVRQLTADVKQAVDGLQVGGFAFCPGLAEREAGHATRLYPTAQVMLDLRRRRPAT